MSQSIRSALRQAAVSVLALLAPPTGRRRATDPRTRTARSARTVSGLRLIVRAVGPPRLPTTPQPYRRSAVRDEGPYLDCRSPLVRPYFLAHERAQGAAHAPRILHPGAVIA